MQNGETDLQTLLQRLRNEVRKRKLDAEAIEREKYQAAIVPMCSPGEVAATERSHLLPSKVYDKERVKEARRALDRAAAKNESVRRWPRFLRGIRRNQEAVNDSLVSSVKGLLQSFESLNSNFSLLQTHLREQTGRNQNQLAQLEQ